MSAVLACYLYWHESVCCVLLYTVASRCIQLYTQPFKAEAKPVLLIRPQGVIRGEGEQTTEPISLLCKALYYYILHSAICLYLSLYYSGCPAFVHFVPKHQTTGYTRQDIFISIQFRVVFNLLRYSLCSLYLYTIYTYTISISFPSLSIPITYNQSTTISTL